MSLAKLLAISLISVATFIPSPPRAAGDKGARSSVAAIEPFIDGQTIVVLRLDADRVDMPSIEKWLAQRAQDNPPRAALDAAGKQLDSFRKAGGHTLFGVVSFGDRAGGMYFALAPLDEKADAQALASSLQPLAFGEKLQTTTIGRAVVLADDATLQKLQHFSPTYRPDLLKAFSEDPDAPVQVAVIPSETTRRVLEAAMPRLPRQVGGGPMTVLTHGMLWASLAVRFPPVPSLKLVVQSQDAESARGFAGLIRLALLSARKSVEGKDSGLMDRVARSVSPLVEADRVILSLNAPQLAELARNLPPAMIAARQRASLEVAESNVRQILLGLIMYANNHQNAAAPSLEEMAKDQDLAPAMLTNPRHPDQQPGYIYNKPPHYDKIPKPSVYVQVYESTQDWQDGVVVGFADGHVELIKDRDYFQKLLEGSKVNP